MFRRHLLSPFVPLCGCCGTPLSDTERTRCLHMVSAAFMSGWPLRVRLRCHACFAANDTPQSGGMADVAAP
jgi:hypothetical protein